MAAKKGGMRWGDVEEDGEMKDSPSVPASQPDAQGVRTVEEFYVNAQGQRVKVTRKVKVQKQTVKLSKSVLARRKWKRFGDCAGKVGPEENITIVEPNHVTLDLSLTKKEEDQKQKDPLDAIADGKSMFVCKYCGEKGHFQLVCPKRNEALPPSMQIEREKQEAAAAAAGPSDSTGKYVPPSRRPGARVGGRGDFDDETPALRVTNLPEDITEADLADLFRPFGHTSRIFLAKDRQTNQSRGFAFINYNSRHEAQRAIDALNGHGYSNLILRVEWAKPRDREANPEK